MKYDKVLMEVAKSFSQLSTCKRLKVGSVISREGRPLVTGYNGTVSGLSNCCEEITDEKCDKCDGKGFTETIGVGIFDCNCHNGKILKTSEFVIHSEQNAIFYAAKFGISTNGCDIHITHAPCAQCAKAIASAGIKRVVYGNKYGGEEGINFLKMCGIKVELIEL